MQVEFFFSFVCKWENLQMRRCRKERRRLVWFTQEGLEEKRAEMKI